MEICLTRILSCIRETKTAERYCPDLARLLEICLRFNLQPQAANKDADPPHAKIAADIISSVFLVCFFVCRVVEQDDVLEACVFVCSTDDVVVLE